MEVHHMKKSLLRPEHIPNGQQYTLYDLEEVNRELNSQTKKMILYLIVTLIVMFGLGLILSFSDGVFGNMIAVVFFILALPVGLAVGMIPVKRTQKIAEIYGLDAKIFKTALDNRNSDKRAWGEPVSQVINYRFRCQKCGYESEWFTYILTSCTEDTLRDKVDDFKNQTMKKRRYFESKHGRLRYSLERKCPHCGKMQRKHPPRWWSIPLIVAVTYVICVIMIGINEATIDSDFFNNKILFFVFFASPFFAIIRYILLKILTKNNMPEYYFADTGRMGVDSSAMKVIPGGGIGEGTVIGKALPQEKKKMIFFLAAGFLLLLTGFVAVVLLVDMMEKLVYGHTIVAVLEGLTAVCAVGGALGMVLQRKLVWYVPLVFAVVLCWVTAQKMWAPYLGEHWGEPMILSLAIMIPSLCFFPQIHRR